MKEQSFEAFEEFPFTPDPENSLVQAAQFCKAIAPKGGKSAWASGGLYGKAHPRIVKSEFKTPRDWEEVARWESGQSFTTLRDDGIEAVEIPVTDGFGRILVHTCQKPYDTCHQGFWGRWE